MTKDLKYLAVTRDLNFAGLKKQDREFLYKEYPVIIRAPRGISDVENYNLFCKHCLNMPLKDRQIIYKGSLINLSKKEYLMVCTLLLWGYIAESEFNKIDFRPNRCKKANEKAPRNLEKSVEDLAQAFWEKVSKERFKASEESLDKNAFKKNFKENFAQYQYRFENTVSTCYSPADLPDFLKKVCKQKAQ